MITKFKIEGEKPDKQELIDYLALTASQIISLLDQPGEWECTEDVTNFDKPTRKFKGRMNLVYRSPARS